MLALDLINALRDTVCSRQAIDYILHLVLTMALIMALIICVNFKHRSI